MSKFRVGETVWVKPFEKIEVNEYPNFTNSMKDYCERVYIVRKILEDGCIVLSENSYKWNEKWLESEEEHQMRVNGKEKEKKVKTYDPSNKKRLLVSGLGCGITVFEEVTPIDEMISYKAEEVAVLATKALEHFGDTAQICQTMEECAELIQALNKSLRHQDDPEAIRHNILKELADVTIMVEQMKLHFDEEEEFDEILEEKMDKLRSYLSEQEAD